jgi:hypothetical protein
MFFITYEAEGNPSALVLLVCALHIVESYFAYKIHLLRTGRAARLHGRNDPLNCPEEGRGHAALQEYLAKRLF